jgi:murein DD-endopeptidase MepM/ murein hydrolase activator NlpD
MKTAEEYIRNQLIAGRLTESDIARLTQFYQHNSGVDLAVDGKPGPLTLTALREAFGDKTESPKLPDPKTFGLIAPMPILAGLTGVSPSRRPVITSGFGPRGQGEQRHFHAGVDLFYPFRDGDKPDTVGDGLGADRQTDSTRPRWVVPFGTPAVAAGSGVVTFVGELKTGLAIWIDLGIGWRVGYFHLKRVGVSVGQRVEGGFSIGEIGHNPVDGDACHLHFELSPVDRYAPIDPAPYIRGLGTWGDK